ncbi:NlpC/P60 family protein [Ahrensia sp. R2A130]|uniref:NlpC/P60 family protein n=1 Tax=Ahrensia sp. R2A130 TaxID=744979 RepID=UPI0001E0E8C8|nr:NlpC/P60 family protein [Ahrensia sp. R2A130]EFL88966.1 putative phage cell wall peptidase, NlpC/P60 family [Ahrensia sp. R2A130]
MKNHEVGERVVATARQWLGTPYIHQASVKGVGADCIGLIRGVWREVEGQEPQQLPNYSSTWSDPTGQEDLLVAGYTHFREVAFGEDQPGDVLIFRMRRGSAAKHAGILSSSRHFIHAYEGNTVVESALSSFWSDRIGGIFRFPSSVCSDVKEPD